MSYPDYSTKEIGEMLDMMSSKLPALLKEVFQILYSEEGAATMSKAIATFYKNLLDTGMNKDDAMLLTQEYMATLKSMTSQFGNS